MAGVAAAGRARWKIENESNNVLKNRGYQLEHNRGHGKKHLASLLVTMNLPAFGLHTLLELADENYRLLRATVGARQRFFQHLDALTTYLHFETWQKLLDFMMRGLEIGPYAVKKAEPGNSGRSHAVRREAAHGLAPPPANPTPRTMAPPHPAPTKLFPTPPLRPRPHSLIMRIAATRDHRSRLGPGNRRGSKPHVRDHSKPWRKRQRQFHP